MIENSQHIGARRQSADNVYWSADSLMRGAVAFLVAQGALRNAMLLSALLALAFAGIVSAGEWAKQDRISVAYLLFRYEMLKQSEGKAGVLFPIFHREGNFYKEGNGCITYFGFLAGCGPRLPRRFGFFCTSWWLRQLRAS